VICSHGYAGEPARHLHGAGIRELTRLPQKFPKPNRNGREGPAHRPVALGTLQEKSDGRQPSVRLP
jgi:hypothetical protein